MPDDKFQATFQDFHFPKAGLHVIGPIGRQPVRPSKVDGQYVRTTRSGINVRSYEPTGGRDRGGSRCGQSKYIAQVLTDGWVVQHINAFGTTVSSGSMQQSRSGRVVYLVAVSQGLVKFATPGDTTWTATTNNTGESPPLNFDGVMASASNNQLLYFVDGTNYAYFKPATTSIEKWTPSVGSLPRDSENNGARLICTWRGRSVLSGLLKDPQNWFMSAVSNPNDFAYLPLGSPVTMAVAGNNSPLGLVGDVITALIPYTDDVLIFGGDHTIYAMRGDPADGGRIDLVSDITGIAWDKAWCKDPYGNIYFFGNRPSIWKMTGPNKPERISQPIEPLLADIDTGNTIITMAWDDRSQEVHVYVTPDDAPASATHYVWEMRTNSWWTDTFANNNLNPLCCVAYDGNNPGDRAILLGGWDGFVRFIDVTATTDDGTPISSSVLLGPILTQELDEMLLKEIQGILATGSGDVTYDILAARTAEAAFNATSRASGTFSAGRNLNQPIRVADHAIYIRLSSTNRWALETIRAKFAGRGKVRRRN